MQKWRLEFEAEWVPRKAHQIGMLIGQDHLRGAVNYTGLKAVNPDGEIEDKPKPKLKLRCHYNPWGRGRCGEEWEADVFTPCPKCEQRKWVVKVEPEKAEEVA